MRRIPRDARRAWHDKDCLGAEPRGDTKASGDKFDGLFALFRIVGAQPLAPAESGGKRAQPDTLLLRVGGEFLRLFLRGVDLETVADR